MSNMKSTAVSAGDQVEVVPDDELPELAVLRPMQRAFVMAFVSGPVAGDAVKACVVAGYSQKSAPGLASRMVHMPHIRAAIDAVLRAAVSSTLTVQAVAVIGRIINDPDASLKLRGDMAAKIVEISGLGERVKTEKAKETGLADKPIGQMSRADLEALVKAGAGAVKAMLANPGDDAVVIGSTSAGDSAPVSAQRTPAPSE